MKNKNEEIEEIVEIEPINVHCIKIKSTDDLKNFDVNAFAQFINQLRNQ